MVGLRTARKIDARMGLTPFKVICYHPWLQAHLDAAIANAVPKKGKTYWDWRDKPDDPYWVYVLELNEHIVYVGQTAKGSADRLQQHKNVFSTAKVVARHGFVDEMARINVRNRNEAVGLEKAIWQELDAHDYMSTIGEASTIHPDARPLPHRA